MTRGTELDGRGRLGNLIFIKIESGQQPPPPPSAHDFLQVVGGNSVIGDDELKWGCEGRNEEFSRILSDFQVRSIPGTL